MLNLLWDLYQSRQIRYLGDKVDQVEQNVTAQTPSRYELARLEEKIDRLALICRALSELVQESDGIAEERLKEKILEIDLRDGKADGKMTSQPRRCPKCNAMMSLQFGRCLFCGEKDDRLL